MLDRYLRIQKERILSPIARLCAGRIAPTSITLIAFAAGMGAVVCASRGMLWATLVLWALNRIGDGLDGTVARMAEQASSWGGYLDIVLDFVVYAALPIALVWGDPTATPSLWFWLSVMQGAFFINAGSLLFLAGILESRGQRASGEMTTLTMPPALIEGTETVWAYALFIAMPQYRALLFAGFAAAVMLNVLQRLGWAYRALEQ